MGLGIIHYLSFIIDICYLSSIINSICHKYMANIREVIL